MFFVEVNFDLNVSLLKMCKYIGYVVSCPILQAFSVSKRGIVTVLTTCLTVYLGSIAAWDHFSMFKSLLNCYFLFRGFCNGTIHFLFFLVKNLSNFGNKTNR